MYRVEILTVPGYPHSPRVFQETADAFEGALKDLGMWAADGVPIVFGAHLMQAKVPEGAIIYNTEVCTSSWLSLDYAHRLRMAFRVLDYSAENVSWLWERCSVRAAHCPIGYHRSLTRLTLQEPEIDVLFYGAITDRRAKILRAVQETGLSFRFITHDEDWSERDYWLPRTKILLNIHAYENAPLETVRLSYAISNGVLALTEWPVPDDWLSLVATHHDLPRACQEWCFAAETETRKRIAAEAKERFSRLLQADILRSVLT